MNNYNNYTPRVQQVLARMNKLAKDYNHAYLGTEHLTLALFLTHGATSLFEEAGVDTVDLLAKLQVAFDARTAEQTRAMPVDKNELASVICALERAAAALKRMT